MSTAERLFEEAMDLPEDELRDLVDRLNLAVLGTPPGHPIEDEAYWGPELARRAAAMDAGEPGIPIDEVIADARSLVRAHANVQRES